MRPAYPERIAFGKVAVTHRSQEEGAFHAVGQEVAGAANSQKADGGGGCYVPEASKDSVGVYEGDANSHFQE